MSAFEAEASMTSDSLMPPVPEWITLTLISLGGELLERLLEGLHGAVDVGLDDDPELLDLAFLDHFVEVLEGDLAYLLRRFYPLEFLPLLCNLLGELLGLDALEGVARRGHARYAKHLDRRGRPGLVDLACHGRRTWPAPCRSRRRRRTDRPP